MIPTVPFWFWLGLGIIGLLSGIVVVISLITDAANDRTETIEEANERLLELREDFKIFKGRE